MPTSSTASRRLGALPSLLGVLCITGSRVSVVMQTKSPRRTGLYMSLRVEPCLRWQRWVSLGRYTAALTDANQQHIMARSSASYACVRPFPLHAAGMCDTKLVESAEQQRRVCLQLTTVRTLLYIVSSLFITCLYRNQDLKTSQLIMHDREANAHPLLCVYPLTS